MRRLLNNSVLPSLLVTGFFAVALTACKPTYPKCETDDHCSEKGEVCVNGQCQECRDDDACVTKHGAGHECVSGRCEVKPECRTDSECSTVGEGLVCRSKKCVPECTANENCPGGMKCEAQRCVPECSQDIDCGPGRSCSNGACTAQRDDSNVSAACRPVNPGAGDVVGLPTVYFEFNEFGLTPDARTSLSQAADCLKQAGGKLNLVIEGHGDERGTQEYNLALGERRATTVRSYMRNLGIDQSRMKTRSMGENQPVCTEQSEECYARNRRVQFIQQRGQM
jgi:peptidoglycan-associated lipoprotein